jgi:hypothetical protein
MIQETGLEAGDAIDGERSCFKASSGNHSESGVTLVSTIILPAGTYASFFYVFSPKYSEFLLPRRETRKSKGASVVPRFADLGVMDALE